MRNLKTTIIKSIIVFFILFLISSACSSNESEPDPDIVACVGKQKISARDFQLNYEFGFAHLKKTNGLYKCRNVLINSHLWYWYYKLGTPPMGVLKLGDDLVL